MTLHPNRPIKIAVVGLGKAGLRHIEAISSLEAFTLVGVADTNERVRENATSLQVPVVSTLSELLPFCPEAVILALPHALLASAADEALRHQLHLLLEKPMALTVNDARTITAQAQAQGLCLMVNFNHRFREEYQHAKAFIREGYLGQPTLFIDQMFSGAGPLPGWVWQKEVSGGGMMMYNGVHSIDRLSWLADTPIVAVQAAAKTLHYAEALEDTLVGILHFASGALGNVIQHKSQAPVTLGRWDTLIYGEDGALRVQSGVGLELATRTTTKAIQTQEGNRFVGALKEFYAAITEQRSPIPNGHDGIRTLRYLDALYRSAREGQLCTLDEQA